MKRQRSPVPSTSRGTGKKSKKVSDHEESDHDLQTSNRANKLKLNTKKDDSRGIITNKRLEDLATGVTRRFLGEIVFHDVIGNLNKNNPELNKTRSRAHPLVCDLNKSTYGHLRIENTKSEGPIFIGFPWGPTINVSKICNLLTNWKWELITPKFMTNLMAVRVFLPANLELTREYGKLSTRLQDFLKDMERHDETRYLHQCYHIECLALSFGIASDECCGIACDVLPFTTFCYYKTSMLPTKNDMNNHISYGTRLTEDLQVELVDWMRLRLNLAIMAPIKYVLEENSPLRSINIQAGIDRKTFKKCQLMRHYTCNLAISRNGNFHQENTQILKQFNNSFEFGSELVLEKYLRNVRGQHDAFREDQRLISTKTIYELISLLDGIAAKYWYPQGNDDEILAIVRTGNRKRLSTIHNGRLNCDKCNQQFGDFTGLIKHYSTREYVLSKKFQCPLCTRSRCLRQELIDHLERTHGANYINGKLFRTQEPKKMIVAKYDIDELVEIPVHLAICGYDEKHVKIVKKETTSSAEVAGLVTEMNNYTNVLTNDSSDSDSVDSESESEPENEPRANVLSPETPSIEGEREDTNTKSRDEPVVGDGDREQKREEEDNTNDQEGGNDDIEMEIHLGEFSLDGCYPSPPSSTAVSLSPDPAPKKDDQPMERKLLKTLLLINSLEGDLSSEHNYIATNYVNKLHHIREGVNDVIEELLVQKANDNGNSPANNATVLLNTSDESPHHRIT